MSELIMRTRVSAQFINVRIKIKLCIKKELRGPLLKVERR